jgi:hypothetical protein
MRSAMRSIGAVEVSKSHAVSERQIAREIDSFSSVNPWRSNTIVIIALPKFVETPVADDHNGYLALFP